jgi:hypothetical protein
LHEKKGEALSAFPPFFIQNVNKVYNYVSLHRRSPGNLTVPWYTSSKANSRRYTLLHKLLVVICLITFAPAAVGAQGVRVAAALQPSDVSVAAAAPILVAIHVAAVD